MLSKEAERQQNNYMWQADCRRRWWGQDNQDVLAGIGLILSLSAVLNCVLRQKMRICAFFFFSPKSVKVSASWPLAKKESGPVCLPERCERTHEAGQIRPFTCYTCSRNNGSNNRPHSFIFLSTWPFILAGSSLEIRIFFLAFTTQIAEIVLLETSHTEHWDWK